MVATVFAEGIWASVPVKTVAPGTYEVVQGVTHSAFAQEKIAISNDELVGERETVADLLG